VPYQKRKCNMRKTNQKRQHILDTALRLFQSKGFANTSMSEITAEAGGSKATVYNYFPAKEELFVECMTYVNGEYFEGIFDSLKGIKGELPAALLEKGKDALRSLMATQIPPLVATSNSPTLSAA
jgi:AcrR family transcriptional regulator